MATKTKAKPKAKKNKVPKTPVKKTAVKKKTTAKKHVETAKTSNGEGLHRLFLDELEDMYSSENQIVESLPKLIKLAQSQDLRDGLRNHLKETKEQVKRIKTIFSILGLPARENRCEGMEGLLKEADELVTHKKKSPTLDAAIISAAQKVEHYEIASYGILRSFAQHLSFQKEIINLIQESLDEEGAADKHLTKIAEGGLFFGGVNKEAANYDGK